MNQLQTLLSNLNTGRQPMGRNQNPPLDPQRFQQMARSISEDQLVQMVQQARRQGIPESDIEQGLNYLMKMR